MKRDPEKTLKGRLALMTEDRDHFKSVCEEQIKKVNDLQAKIKARNEQYIGFKNSTRLQLEWYRNHIQVLVSKIPPGGGR